MTNLSVNFFTLFSNLFCLVCHPENARNGRTTKSDHQSQKTISLSGRSHGKLNFICYFTSNYRMLCIYIYIFFFFLLITFFLVLDPDDANSATRKRKNIQFELPNTNIKRIGTLPLSIFQLQLKSLFN